MEESKGGRGPSGLIFSVSKVVPKQKKTKSRTSSAAVGPFKVKNSVIPQVAYFGHKKAAPALLRMGATLSNIGDVISNLRNGGESKYQHVASEFRTQMQAIGFNRSGIGNRRPHTVRVKVRRIADAEIQYDTEWRVRPRQGDNAFGVFDTEEEILGEKITSVTPGLMAVRPIKEGQTGFDPYRGNREGQRYFTIDVAVMQQDNYEQFVEKIKTQIRSISADRAANYDDPDNDDFDLFDIMGAQDVSVNMNAGDEVAFHQFSKLKSFEGIAMAPVRMRDFNCVYESLCIIYHFERFGCAPHAIVSSWTRFVLSLYLCETPDEQQRINNGTILTIITSFCANYNMNIGMFNAHQYYLEMKRLEIIADKIGEGQMPKYYIVYYSHHAFPVRAENLEQLGAIIDNLSIQEGLVKGRQATHFALVPPNFKFYNLELLMVVSRQLTLEECFFYKSGIKPAYFHACAQIESRKQGWYSNQKIIYQFMARYINMSLDEMINVFREVREGDQSGNHAEEDEELKRQYIKEKKIKCPFTLPIVPVVDDYHEDLRMKIHARAVAFEELGVAAVDIETCIDNSLDYSLYNMRPFMVHLHGRMRRRKLQKSQDGHIRVISTLHLVDVVFIGLDCCEQFVEYLLVEGYSWSDAEYNELLDHQQGATTEQQIFNYIFAHNGFGFDFLYFFEPLIRKMSGFSIIGDASKPKGYSGNGIFEYDFMMIYKEKLETLGKTFFPGQEEMWKGSCKAIIGMPIQELKDLLASPEGSIVSDRPGIGVVTLAEIAKYCRQDCVVLYNIVCKFFGDLYTKPMGMGMVKKSMYHSLSAISWDVLKNCFLKTPIFINPFTQADEQRMKIGGLAVEYRHESHFGTMIDVTSEYPSAMMNLMPVHYVRGLGPEVIEMWPGDHELTQDNIGENKIVHHNIYYVRFKFPHDCVLPTICVRNDETLSQPLQHEHYDADGNEGDWLPIWGDSILTAFQCVPGVKFRILKYVQFRGEYIFKDFIETMFANRQRCKQQVPPDTIGDTFYKGIMNMAFGKFSQKNYAKAFVGTKVECIDKLNQIEQYTDIQDYTLRELVTERVPMYELKIVYKDDDLTNKGALVRISSYIMEMSRNHLMRMKHAVAKEFGHDAICYCDTDSIAVAFDKVNPSAAIIVQQFYDEYTRACIEGNEEAKIEAGKGLKQRLVESKEIMRLKELTIRDLTNIQSQEQPLLIDQVRLGACKIERYFARGVFLAPKQYSLWGWSEKGTAHQMIKLKGVQQRFITPAIFDSMISYTNDIELIKDELTGEEIEVQVPSKRLPIAMIQLEQWRRRFTGCSIVNQIKLITFAHKKRLHDLETCTSRPFKTVKDQARYAYKVAYKIKKIKENEKFSRPDIVKAFEDLRESLSFGVSATVDSLHARFRTHAMVVQGEARDTLDESRKRFMLQLPKYRWDSIHDPILRIMSQASCVNESVLILPKLYSIVHKAVYYRKTLDKKTACYNLEYDISARVITYCLYGYRLLIDNNIPIPKNFEQIVGIYKDVVKDFVNVDESLQMIHPQGGARERQRAKLSWSNAVDWGLRFLSCSIPLVDYQKMPSIPSKDYMRVMPLNESVEITTLWKFMTNMMNNVGMIKSSLEQGSERYDQMLLQLHQYTPQLPLYNDATEAFDFISELQLKEMVVQSYASRMNQAVARGEESQTTEANVIIGKRIDRKGKEQRRFVDENGLVEFDMSDALQGDVHQQELLGAKQDYIKSAKIVEIEEASKQKLMFKLFMATPMYGDLIENQEQRRIMLENFLALDEFPIKDEKELYKIFSRQVNENISIGKNHIIDFCLVYQFLYFGGMRARSLIVKVVTDWRTMAGMSNDVRVFIMAIRIIFQRPSMFDTFMKTTTSLPKKIKDFFGALLKIIIPFDVIADRAAVETDEQLAHQLRAIINNTDICQANFARILHYAVSENDAARDLGQQMTERLLYWSEPSPEMIIKLKAILAVQAPLGGDNARHRAILAQNRVDEIVTSEEWGQLVTQKMIAYKNAALAEPFPPVQVSHRLIQKTVADFEEDKQEFREEMAEIQQEILAYPGCEDAKFPAFNFELVQNMGIRKENRQRVETIIAMTPRSSEFDLQSYQNFAFDQEEQLDPHCYRPQFGQEGDYNIRDFNDVDIAWQMQDDEEQDFVPAGYQKKALRQQRLEDLQDSPDFAIQEMIARQQDARTTQRERRLRNIFDNEAEESDNMEMSENKFELSQ